MVIKFFQIPSLNSLLVMALKSMPFLNKPLRYNLLRDILGARNSNTSIVSPSINFINFLSSPIIPF